MMDACKKKPVEAPAQNPLAMIFTNLKDSAIAFGRVASFDLDTNGQKDVLFSTLLVGDGINQQDKRQWYVSSSFETNLPVNEQESIPVLHINDLIPLQNFSGYNWFNASSVLLAQQIIGINNPPFWAGDWKDASHRFIPVQLISSNGLLNGWIEISFSITQEKVILHKAAVSKEENKAVQAGK